MRSLRLLLLVMMLAFLPLPGWAGALAHAVDTIGDGLVASATAPAASAADEMAGDAMQADLAAAPDSAPAPESAEPQPQPGADLAEQLLPATPLRLAPWAGRVGPPRYAGAPLPEPDLPLLPRPPRA
ncbi:hypothetical protein CTP10_R32880 [Cupriavidus sp. P-10]|uniref:hypothetical protein n=2 Tax=unclassified Cupriavidus TaxID=2640874 RepID=UPI001F32C447|nr:hypothetical protein [Cupriavidus sp. P-10]BDB25895.1 hypothetical protein CTP10_R32880 [Cupriavidus sp. P-10]